MKLLCSSSFLPMKMFRWSLRFDKDVSFHFCLIYYSLIIAPLDPVQSELEPALSNKLCAEKINKPLIVQFGNMKYIFRSVLNEPIYVTYVVLFKNF